MFQVVHLSQKLKKKEHQLEMAEHKIDMLVKAVRDLEEHMTRLSAMGKRNTRVVTIPKSEVELTATGCYGTLSLWGINCHNEWCTTVVHRYCKRVLEPAERWRCGGKWR